jgi:hypothetical protein
MWNRTGRPETVAAWSRAANFVECFHETRVSLSAVSIRMEG